MNKAFRIGTWWRSDPFHANKTTVHTFTSGLSRVVLSSCLSGGPGKNRSMAEWLLAKDSLHHFFDRSDPCNNCPKSRKNWNLARQELPQCPCSTTSLHPFEHVNWRGNVQMKIVGLMISSSSSSSSTSSVYCDLISCANRCSLRYS